MRASIFVLALGSTLVASAFGGATSVRADQSPSFADRSLLVQVQADPYWQRDRWQRDRYYRPYYRPYYYRPPPPPVVYYPPPPPVYYAPPPRPTFGFWIR